MKRKPRLLIIDDNVSMLETLSDLLEEMGYETQTAKTASEAIRKARESFFNVALIDINLADKTGIEILQGFKSTYPSRLNIMVTASTTLKNAIDAVNFGADGYVMKPVDIKKLDQMIKELLRKQQDILKTSYEKIREYMKNMDEGQTTDPQ
jgi:two-component system nitrogen regulation response regulator GlnG